jgi:hypothetical protein
MWRDDVAICAKMIFKRRRSARAALSDGGADIQSDSQHEARSVASVQFCRRNFACEALAQWNEPFGVAAPFADR